MEPLRNRPSLSYRRPRDGACRWFNPASLIFHHKDAATLQVGNAQMVLRLPGVPKVAYRVPSIPQRPDCGQAATIWACAA